MAPWKDELERLGHEVVATWLALPEGTPRQPDTPAECMEHAWRDLGDIDRADLLVMDTQGGNGPGMNVEWGYAWAKGLQRWRVGPPLSIFHYDCEMDFKNWRELILFLEEGR